MESIITNKDITIRYETLFPLLFSRTSMQRTLWCLSLVEWFSLSPALNGVETGVICREVIPLSEPLMLYSTKIMEEVGMTNYKN